MENGSASAVKPSYSSSSHYVKTVVLRDWWLVRSQTEFEGKNLAVSGLPDEELAVRVFISAPVVKRHSVITLETADGVYVILNGFINRLRSEEGGFLPEVFRYFLFGFPLNWEEYAGRKSGDDECPCPVSSPRKTTVKTTVNGCAATVIATKSKKFPAEEVIDAVRATPAKKSRRVSKSTKSDMAATSGLKDIKTKMTVDTEVSPSVQEGLKSPPVIPSEISSLKKSRSGHFVL